MFVTLFGSGFFVFNLADIIVFIRLPEPVKKVIENTDTRGVIWGGKPLRMAYKGVTRSISHHLVTEETWSLTDSR